MEGALENSPVTAQFIANPQVRITCGETLPDRVVIDLVALANQERLGLPVWEGNEKPIIAPAIESGGIVYEPPDLHPSVREAVTFRCCGGCGGTDRMCYQARDCMAWT
jgi:hypothetical protein